MSPKRCASREITVAGVRVDIRANVHRAVKLLKDDALGLGRLLIEVHPLAQIDLAFERVMAAGVALKVLVG